MNWEALHGRVADGRPGPWWLGGLRAVARAGSWPLALAATARNLGYDLGWASAKRLPVPVIGVGNLAVGGTGKTPLTMEVAATLGELGLPVGVISRGFGGAERAFAWVSRGGQVLATAAQAGDEPVLMARRLALGGLDAPVAVGADRFLVGQRVLAQAGPRVLVGDDMFQHRGLARDLDIVCLDAADPMAGGFLLPRGCLREPLAGLRRAHAVMLTRAEEPDQVERARAWLRSFWGPGPVLAARHRLAGLTRHDGSGLDPAFWQGARVLAFCGLARPDSFAQGLASLGLEVAGLQPFGDHHAFTPAELAGLAAQARAKGATALACSEKDAVRIAQPPPGVDLWVTRLELEIEGGRQALARVLLPALKQWGRAA